MPDEDAPYAAGDPEFASGTFPKRGPFCSKCSVHVPQFAALDPERTAAVLALLDAEGLAAAIRAVMKLTGCDLRWAKIWLIHRGVAVPPGRHFRGPPCPHCGVPLPSERSRQCLACHRDWH